LEKSLGARSVVAGIPFEDGRVRFQDWRGRKVTPFGALPVLEVDGEIPLLP
jgi:hypothetical protein